MFDLDQIRAEMAERTTENAAAVSDLKEKLGDRPLGLEEVLAFLEGALQKRRFVFELEGERVVLTIQSRFGDELGKVSGASLAGALDALLLQHPSILDTVRE